MQSQGVALWTALALSGGSGVPWNEIKQPRGCREIPQPCSACKAQSEGMCRRPVSSILQGKGKFPTGVPVFQAPA